MKFENNDKLSFVSCADYDFSSVYKSVSRIFEVLGGIKKFVNPGDRVLLKPNFLAAKKIETAVTTHPVVIAAVAKIVDEAGAGEIIIGDSPGIGTAKGVARTIKLKHYLTVNRCKIVNFNKTVLIKGERGPFGKFKIAEEISKANVVINLPKVKSHGQMILTGAVKNNFGAIVGMEKPQWHLKAGTDHDSFAWMIIKVMEVVNPSVTIVDGIVGMDGNGPNAGRPRKLGWMIGGVNCHSIDSLICTLLGMNENDVPTLRVALQGYKTDYKSSKIFNCEGDNYKEKIINDFLLPTQVNVLTPGLSKRVGDLLRTPLTEKPIINHRLCTGCSICIKHCPADTIKLVEEMETEAVIDYDKCIRCFCCQEMCPEGAISIAQGHLLSIFDSLGFKWGLRK